MSDDYNIRQGKEIYAKLGVDPFASTDEISAILAQQTDAFAALPDDQKAEHLKQLQSITAILKDPAKRVQLNALLPERIDEKTISSFLSSIDRIDEQQLAPPKPSIADVYTEGASRDLMEEDLVPPDMIASLELDFDAVNTILSNSLKDRELFFDS